jgi:starch phosphorylase
MASLTPAFSANRTVREYTEQHYIPAAAAFVARTADNAAGGASLLAWQREIDSKWKDVRFGALKVVRDASDLVFQAEVFLAGLDPSSVRVELYADAQNGGEPVRQLMQRNESRSSSAAAWIYSTKTPADRLPGDFTPRILPYHPMALPIEVDRICWQK